MDRQWRLLRWHNRHEHAKTGSNKYTKTGSDEHATSRRDKYAEAGLDKHAEASGDEHTNFRGFCLGSGCELQCGYTRQLWRSHLQVSPGAYLSGRLGTAQRPCSLAA